MKIFSTTMLTPGFALAGLLAMSLMTTGCAGGNLPESQRYYYLQENFGKSVKMINFNQTLNPTAGMDPTPVEGLDGRAADMAMEKHRETFSPEHRDDRGNYRESRILQDFDQIRRR